MLDTEAPALQADAVALLDAVRSVVEAIGAVEAERPQAQLADAVAALVKAIAARLG